MNAAGTAGMEAGEGSKDVNALLDEARVPTPVKIAAGVLAGAGGLTALVGVQNLTVIRWLGWMWLLPLFLVAVGVTTALVGAKLARARAWSLKAGIALGVTLVVSTTAFVIVSFASGVYALLSILAMAAGIAALILELIAIDSFREVAATRKKLREAGYDLDF